MQRMRLMLALAASFGTLLACGDDATSASGTDGDTSASSEASSTGSTSPSGETGSASSGDTPGSSETTDTPTSSSSGVSIDASSSSESGEPPAAIEFARGIRLDRLTVNQATQVELVVDGFEVAPADYNTRIIPGRRTLVRGFWKLHTDFEPRQIIGRLTIEYADGTIQEQDFIQMVAGETSDGAGSSSFQWLLEPAAVVPGMKLRARLIEPDPATAPGEVSTPPPIAPLSGQATLGLYDAPLEMKVTLVPVLHQFEGCESMPDITDDDVTAMREQLEQNNAIQTAIMSVREPMPYTATIGGGSGFSAILAALAQARAADMPDANEYYYGLLEPCDGFPPGLLGQAIAIAGPPTMDNGSERVSTGRWQGSGAAAAETFVHEVGHTQGRRHVRCSGGEAGIDVNYPHANGRIGIWGFGIYDFELRSPTGARDYMTYCSNEWVSDYGWEQTLDVIEILTSFDYADTPSTEADGIVLAGMLHEDGTAQWWTRPGRTPAHRYTGRATLELELGGATMHIDATLSDVPHSTARYVEVDVPLGFEAARSASVVADGAARTIAIGEIRRLDRFAL